MTYLDAASSESADAGHAAAVRAYRDTYGAA
jgi:hypothetical protein